MFLHIWYFFYILGLLISWINATQSAKVSQSLYSDVTQSNFGCSCWFDPLEKLLPPKFCACCTDDGIQCGYPRHNWCQPKVSDGQVQTGCFGILCISKIVHVDTLTLLSFSFCKAYQGLHTLYHLLEVPVILITLCKTHHILITLVQFVYLILINVVHIPKFLWKHQSIMDNTVQKE